MTRYHVWLNGLGLQDIDPAIFITDVQEHAPEPLLTTAPRAQGDGLHILRRSRQSLSVAVRFAVREYQPARRSAILQKIRAWALQGGSLTTGDRPGQRLCVDPAELPSAHSTLRWTEELTLLFTARSLPYWEEASPTQAITPATLMLPGDAPSAPMELHWCCTATAAVVLTITTPLSTMTFIDLPAVTGQELVITHASGVLTAFIGETDVLPCRTPESSDDLLLPCGVASAVTVTVDGAAAQGCTVSARGRWL